MVKAQNMINRLVRFYVLRSTITVALALNAARFPDNSVEVHSDLNQTEKFPFNCTSKSSQPVPTNAQKLHPEHIRQVMTLGDSITAGFGMGAEPVEHRGKSWSGGEGDETAPTLPWFLSHFSKKITGASHGEIVPETPNFRRYDAPDNIQSNAAISASKAQDVIDFQIDYLLTRNITDEWKVLSLFIGANDICAGFRACNTTETADDLINEMEEKYTKILERIIKEFKNIYINMNQFFYLSGVAIVDHEHEWCQLVHKVWDECDCLEKRSDRNDWLKTDYAVDGINAAIVRVAKKFNNIRPDVAVHVNKQWNGLRVDRKDMISPLDCFHPSYQTQRLFALSAWNSMFGVNTTIQTGTYSEPHCPGPDDTFVTEK